MTVELPKLALWDVALTDEEMEQFVTTGVDPRPEHRVR